MSLTAQQEDDTRRELKVNFDKAQVTVHEAATALGTTDEYIEQLMRLEPDRLEDTWILKNYLIEKVTAAGKEVTPFTALGGDYHVIWFLNADYIDGKRILKR